MNRREDSFYIKITNYKYKERPCN